MSGGSWGGAQPPPPSPPTAAPPLPATPCRCHRPGRLSAQPRCPRHVPLLSADAQTRLDSSSNGRRRRLHGGLRPQPPSGGGGGANQTGALFALAHLLSTWVTAHPVVNVQQANRSAKWHGEVEEASAGPEAGPPAPARPAPALLTAPSPPLPSPFSSPSPATMGDRKGKTRLLEVINLVDSEDEGTPAPSGPGGPSGSSRPSPPSRPRPAAASASPAAASVMRCHVVVRRVHEGFMRVQGQEHQLD